MDCESPSIDFAAIGHQESWSAIADFVNALRNDKLERLSLQSIRDTYAWLPPMKIFDVKVNSLQEGKQTRGIYVETFIAPDELNAVKICRSKVLGAANIAKKSGAKIAALGGFTSIVLEGKVADLPEEMHYTTGNTLTAAFIAKGIETCCVECGVDLYSSSVLIIGATGDIGSAVARYFAGRCKEMILSGRNLRRLELLSGQLREKNQLCVINTDLKQCNHKVEVIIAVASIVDPVEISNWQPKIVCDAGYPKNLSLHPSLENCFVYHGGMGVVNGGVQYSDNTLSAFYRFPAEHVVHGCLLEAIVLSLEGKPRSFSTGRGNISPEAMEEIYSLAESHGINRAPFYNNYGLCKRTL